VAEAVAEDRCIEAKIFTRLRMFPLTEDVVGLVGG